MHNWSKRFSTGLCIALVESLISKATMTAYSTVHRLFGGIEVPNGLAFVPDGDTMYFCDTPTRHIQAFTLNPATGAIIGERHFGDCERPGHPDGAGPDKQGYLWVAHLGGGRVTRFTPEGRVDRVVPLSVERPTACCFGGEELDTLFVTSSRMNLDAAQLARFPLSGGVFAIKPGVHGLPELVFGQTKVIS